MFAGVFGLGLNWLYQPVKMENLGMAAYKAPARAGLVLPPFVPPENDSTSIAASANLAAPESGTQDAAEAPVAEPKPVRKAAQVKPRRPERREARPDDGWRSYGYSPQNWGYAQQNYGFQRWF